MQPNKSGGPKRTALPLNDSLTKKSCSSNGFLGRIFDSHLLQNRRKKLKAIQPTPDNLIAFNEKENRRMRIMKKVLQKAVIGGYLSERVSKIAQNYIQNMKCVILKPVSVFLRIAFVSFILTGRLDHNGRNASHPFCWNHVDLRKCSFEGTHQCKIICSFVTSADTRKIFILFRPTNVGHIHEKL